MARIDNDDDNNNDGQGYRAQRVRGAPPSLVGAFDSIAPLQWTCARSNESSRGSPRIGMPYGRNDRDSTMASSSLTIPTLPLA